MAGSPTHLKNIISSKLDHLPNKNRDDEHLKNNLSCHHLVFETPYSSTLWNFTLSHTEPRHGNNAMCLVPF